MSGFRVPPRPLDRGGNGKEELGFRAWGSGVLGGFRSLGLRIYCSGFNVWSS